MSQLCVAACGWTVQPTDTVAAFARRLDQVAAEASGRGAELLLLPEYAAMELGPALAGCTGETAELHAVAGAFDALLDAACTVAERRRLWFCPGSLPRRSADGRVRNHAALIAPDGTASLRDKPVMTRFEAERWMVEPGTATAPVDTPWGPVGIAICYAAEFPTVVRAMVEAGAFLILVPACTDTQAGANRVTIAARARAMENQCFVAVAPTLGEAPWSAALDRNHGRSAVYGPVDHGFPDDGILTALEPDEPGLAVATLDPDAIERVRRDGAVRNHRDWSLLRVPA